MHNRSAKLSTRSTHPKKWTQFVDKLLDSNEVDLKLLDDVCPSLCDVQDILRKYSKDTTDTIGLACTKYKATPLTFPYRKNQESLYRKYYSESRLARLESEYTSLCEFTVQPDVLRKHQEQSYTLEQIAHETGEHPHHVFDLQFSVLSKYGRSIRMALFGVADKDATIMTFDGQWFNAHDAKHRKAFEAGINTEKPTTIVCHGVVDSNVNEICKMWQMIDHCRTGLVVSVLGASDLEYASWSCLDRTSSKYESHGVAVKVKLLKTSQKCLEDYGLAVLLTDGPQVSHGGVSVSLRKLKYSINGSPEKTLLHLLVDGWTDMMAAIKPAQSSFLYNLGKLIVGLQNGTTTSSDALSTINHPGRTLFHCGAGCGRSVTVLTSTFMADPSIIGEPNTCIFDIASMLKSRRMHAINCFEHYVSLDLLLLRHYNNANRSLIAASVVADNFFAAVKQLPLQWLYHILVLCLCNAEQNIAPIYDVGLWFTFLSLLIKFY